MSKSFMFKLLIILSLGAAALLWLLSVFDVFNTGNMDIGMWAIALAAGGCGVAFILYALFSKTSSTPVTLKRLWVFTGVGLVLVAVFALINIFAEWNDKFVLPIIAIAGVAVLLISLFATGGKKWDQGDNKNVGYKNYHQRKAEQEAKEKKERGE